MRKILTLSMLLLSIAFAAQDSQPKLELKGEIFFIGEVTEETCALDYDKVARTVASRDIEKSISSNCAIKENLRPTSLSRVKVNSFKPATTNEKKLENYTFFTSEYL